MATIREIGLFLFQLLVTLVASGAKCYFSSILNPGKCVDTIRDLRNAKCGRSKSKKSGNSVLNDLKTSLECDAFNAAANNSKVFNVTLVVLMSLLIKRLA